MPLEASSFQRLWKIAILPISTHLGLLILFDLSDHIAATLLLIGAAFLGVFLAERQLRGISEGRLWWFLMGVAAVLRILLLPLPPTLSEDVERYVWDGRVVQHGHNPYLLSPDSPELDDLRDPLWEGLPHRDVPTVYPPLAQTLFAVSAFLPSSVYSLKLILILLDLGTCALLLLLARTWSISPERTLWYAWNPLVTMEIAGMGHVDGFGVTLVVLTTTLLAVSSNRVARAAISAAAAILVKLVPVLAIPVWARQCKRRGYFLAAVLVLTGVGLLPVLVSTGRVPPGLVEYGVSWEFNGPVFETLWRLLDRLDLQSSAEIGLNRLKEWTGRHDFWNLLYPLNYPQLWAKMILAGGLLLALIWSWRTRETARSLVRVFGSILIFSATVYPWYALWILPWAALVRHRAWLALSGLLFLSYLPQIWDVPLYPWVHASIWLPFFFLLIMESRWSTR